MSGMTVGLASNRVLGGGRGPHFITLGHGTEPNRGRSKIGPIAGACNSTPFDRASPLEFAFTEVFNGRLRDECLNVHRFTSMADAQAIIEAWRVDYNQCGSHNSFGYITPHEFVAQRQAIWNSSLDRYGFLL